LGTVSTGNTPSRRNLALYGDYIEWIKSDNLNTPERYATPATERLSELGFKECRWVPAGSVLVTCIAGSLSCIGNAAMADRTVAFNQQINAIVPHDRTNALFLYALVVMSKRAIQDASTNSMKGMVSKSKFAGIKTIAPSLAIQDEYANRLQANLAAELNQRRAVDLCNKLYQSLQQRAFRGDL